MGYEPHPKVRLHRYKICPGTTRLRLGRASHRGVRRGRTVAPRRWRAPASAQGCGDRMTSRFLRTGIHSMKLSFVDRGHPGPPCRPGARGLRPGVEVRPGGGRVLQVGLRGVHADMGQLLGCHHKGFSMNPLATLTKCNRSCTVIVASKGNVSILINWFIF